MVYGLTVQKRGIYTARASLQVLLFLLQDTSPSLKKYRIANTTNQKNQTTKQPNNQTTNNADPQNKHTIQPPPSNPTNHRRQQDNVPTNPPTHQRGLLPTLNQNPLHRHHPTPHPNHRLPRHDAPLDLLPMRNRHLERALMWVWAWELLEV